MKKSILILTDFSENALHAAEEAFALAGQLRLNLVLLNCNDTITAVTYYPVVPVLSDSPTWYEDRKSKLKLIAEHLEKKFHNTLPEQARPVIKRLIREGDLQTNLKDLLKRQPIEMIVMGARSGSSTEHFLFGSDTKTVADHASIPVLIVPFEHGIRQVLHITFATNFLEQDIDALHYLLEIRQKLGAKLDILHIRLYGQLPGPRDPQVERIIHESCIAKPSMITITEVYGKEIGSRINHYCKTQNSDILALSHEHHSLLFRAFNEGVVTKRLSDHQIPLLIIPELKISKETAEDTMRGLSNIIF